MAISGRALLLGVRDVSPILLGVVPFGLVTGASATAVGMSDLQAITMSAIVYAGVAQVTALQLIALSSPLAVILATTLMINLRLSMYGAAIAPHLRAVSLPTRALMAYLLTDQSFALSVFKYRDDPAISRRDYYLGTALGMWVTWITATAVGALFGALVPASWSLDFVIPLLFLALLIPALRDRPTLMAALVAAAVALAAAGLPNNLGLILASLCGVSAGVASEGRRRAR